VFYLIREEIRTTYETVQVQCQDFNDTITLYRQMSFLHVNITPMYKNVTLIKNKTHLD